MTNNTFAIRKYITTCYNKSPDNYCWYNIPKLLSDEDLNKMKAYFLIIGTKKENIEVKKELAKKLNELKIEVGIFNCFLEEEEIEIKDYEMIEDSEGINFKVIENNHELNEVIKIYEDMKED